MKSNFFPGSTEKWPSVALFCHKLHGISTNSKVAMSFLSLKTLNAFFSVFYFVANVPSRSRRLI